MEIPRHSDITYFATTNYRDRENMFGIKRRDRRQHVYVLGKSGTGKSTLINNMIVQNIANGEGVAVVDPHGELVEDILRLIPPERKDDVVYFNPSDDDFHIGFNVMEVPDPKYKHLIASGLMGIFTKIWANAWSSRMEYILNNTILALLDTPGTTMLGIPRMLVDHSYRQFILSNVTDPVVRGFWVNEFEAWQDRFRNEAIAPIQNKVGQFLSTSVIRNIVGQEKSTINIFDIMNEKRILLVNVSKGRIGEDNSALLGAMLITKIQLAAMERVRIPEEMRKDFYLYVDEFQNFVTDSFATILSESRKYRLCLTLAHQYIGQLVTSESTSVRDAIFGNVGSMIVFRVGAADAEFLEKEFEPEFGPQDFVNLPNYTIYTKLMIDGVTSRPFSAATLPPFSVEGSNEIAEQIVERSRELYALPRSKVEQEIDAWSRQNPGQKPIEEIPDKPEEVTQDPDGKYRIKCSLFDECGNIAEVPFQPEKGRPVYCKEHVEKIKSGELVIEEKKEKKNSNPPEKSKKNTLKTKKSHVPSSQKEKQPYSEKKERNNFEKNNSLGDILSAALGTKQEAQKTKRSRLSQEIEAEKELEAQPTISLNDLTQKKSPEKKPQQEQKNNSDTTSEEKVHTKFSRQASEGSMSALQSALAKVKKQQHSSPEISSKEVSEPEKTASPYTSKPAEESQPKPQPKKEIPEDILRQVLE